MLCTKKVRGIYSVLILLLLSFFPNFEQVQGCGIVYVFIISEVIRFTVWVNLFLMVGSSYCVSFSLVFFRLFVSQWRGFHIWGTNYHCFLELPENKKIVQKNVVLLLVCVEISRGLLLGKDIFENVCLNK